MATIEMCDPATWPCPPLLALVRKGTGERGTLYHTHGEPRHVIHAPCSVVRGMLNAGGDPLSQLNGSSVSRCEELAWDWEVDADQALCCDEGQLP